MSICGCGRRDVLNVDQQFPDSGVAMWIRDQTMSMLGVLKSAGLNVGSPLVSPNRWHELCLSGGDGNDRQQSRAKNPKKSGRAGLHLPLGVHGFCALLPSFDAGGANSGCKL
ncbi:MAG: hypothetical protein WD648_06260 [Planctomycetaceae bacterium]